MELSPSETKCIEEIKQKIERLGRKILFVNGAVGTGKTTIAKFLAKKLNGKYLSIIFDFDTLVKDSKNIRLSKILKKVDDELSSKWIFIDDTDPILFELKSRDLFLSDMISIFRSVYSKKFVFFSSNILELISEKESALKSIITKENIASLEFNSEDSYFLQNNIRNKGIFDQTYYNFYGV